MGILGWLLVPMYLIIKPEQKENKEDLTLYQFQEKMIKLGYWKR